jgi:hypothetical protein
MLTLPPPRSAEPVIASDHLGTPWFLWEEDSRHPEYCVTYDGRSIQCRYLRYGVYDGILYKMGTEGASQMQFA